MSELHVQLSGLNVNMIQWLECDKLGQFAWPRLVAAPEHKIWTVAFSFLSRSVANFAVGDSLRFKAFCLFNPTALLIHSVVSDMDMTPGVLVASLSMDEVIENSLYRSLMLATLVSSTDGILSRVHTERVNGVLAELDALCQLTSLIEFLDYDSAVRARLENGAYELPEVEGEAAVRRTCEIIVDVMNAGLVDANIARCFKTTRVQERCNIRVERIEGIASGKRRLIAFPTELIVSYDGNLYHQPDKLPVFSAKSRYLPSRLFDGLCRCSSSTESGVEVVNVGESAMEIFDQARVITAFAISTVCANSFTAHEYNITVNGMIGGVAVYTYLTSLAPLLVAMSVGNYIYQESKKPQTLPWQVVFENNYHEVRSAFTWVKRIANFLARPDHVVLAYNLNDPTFSNRYKLCGEYLAISNQPSEFAQERRI